MGGDDELGLLPDKVVHARDDRELPAGGEGGLWFIKQVEPLTAKVVDQQGEEGFSVRLLVQRALAVAWTDGRSGSGLRIQLLDFSGHIEEAFGSEEKSIPRTRDAPGDAQVVMQLGVRVAGPKSEVLGPAFGVEAAGHCDGLKQGGFAGAILADKERNRWMKFQPFEWSYRRERERIPIE